VSQPAAAKGAMARRAVSLPKKDGLTGCTRHGLVTPLPCHYQNLKFWGPCHEQTSSLDVVLFCCDFPGRHLIEPRSRTVDGGQWRSECEYLSPADRWHSDVPGQSRFRLAMGGSDNQSILLQDGTGTVVAVYCP
jgi:hypothetical protein